jgi:aspartate carbamoyltransferase catalytic subunit
MKSLSVSNFLGIKYLQPEDLHLIFETAIHFKEVINRPIKKVPSLRDVTIANLFFESSTRTKLSFELAEKRLSADVISLSTSQSSVNKGETLVDTVNNILAMKVDMIIIRHPNPGSAHFLSKHVDSCIINAGDGTHEHPSQALLDAFSLQEKFGDLKGKRIAIVGDILHSRVALSNIYALKMLGADVKLCAPKSLLPKHIESLDVSISSDLVKTLNWCDAANMLRVQNERMDLNYFPSIREYTQKFGLTGKLLKQLRKKIVVLHPGPINRGVEISSEVADSDQAIILDQVENGVAVRMAIIYLLASKIIIPKT